MRILKLCSKMKKLMQARKSIIELIRIYLALNFWKITPDTNDPMMSPTYTIDPIRPKSASSIPNCFFMSSDRAGKSP